MAKLKHLLVRSYLQNYLILSSLIFRAITSSWQNIEQIQDITEQYSEQNKAWTFPNWIQLLQYLRCGQ